MAEKLIIRPYIPDDIPAIAEIEKRCFSMPWSEKSLREFCVYPFGRILTAELDGQVAGYITYSQIFEEVQIANVAVAPGFRRMGIAEKLIRRLLSDGIDNNSETVFLEVRESNIPARSLYEKCGFYVVGERKGYYSNPKEDAVLMNYTYPPRKEQ